jgi:nucleotide-binding universal stress UspA family protein
MVTTGQIWKWLQDKPIALLKMEERVAQKRMLLVPFEPSQLSPQMLESALNMAETKSAELFLLCVRPPAESMWYAQEDERVFSNLKGLQAQLQKSSIPVNIEAVAGPVAQFVRDFADQNNADMILISGHQVASLQFNRV